MQRDTLRGRKTKAPAANGPYVTVDVHAFTDDAFGAAYSLVLQGRRAIGRVYLAARVQGVELGGRNYFVASRCAEPPPGRDELLKRESLSLQGFLADLRERGTRLNLVILDA